MKSGGANGTNIALMVLGLVGLVIGVNLLPTVVGSVIPTLAGDATANNAGLTRTVMQFIPVAFSAGMLAIAFGLAVNTGVSGQKSPEFKPVMIIFGVIVVVIGINLVGTIGSAQQTAINATYATTSTSSTVQAPAGPLTAAGSVYVGGVTIGTWGTGCSATAPGACAWGTGIKDFITGNTTPNGADIVNKANNIQSQLGLTRTIAGFLQIGYIITILAAAFSLAEIGSGGKASAAVRGGARRLRGLGSPVMRRM